MKMETQLILSLWRGERFCSSYTVVLVIFATEVKKRKAEIKICAFGFLWSGYHAFSTNLCYLCGHANCPQIGLIAFLLRSTMHCKDHYITTVAIHSCKYKIVVLTMVTMVTMLHAPSCM